MVPQEEISLGLGEDSEMRFMMSMRWAIYGHQGLVWLLISTQPFYSS